MTPKQITKIAYSKRLNEGKMEQLETLAQRLGVIRSLVWQGSGSVNGAAVGDREIRDAWMEEGFEGVPSNYWKETLRDAKADIRANQAAAMVQVKRNVFARTSDKEEQHRLFGLLKSGRWGEDRWLSSQMRNRWTRGHNHTFNQIVVRSDTYKTKPGWVGIPGLVPGRRICIPLTSNHEVEGTLRLILRSGRVEVHYAVDAPQGSPCGTETLGVDKGYTEVFVDSAGNHYGQGLGALLTAKSDSLTVKDRRRNKLRAIAKNTADAAKAARIHKNNLGTQKRDRRAARIQAELKTLTYTAAHQLVDKAAVTAAEDLTKPFTGKNLGKKMNRRLSAWTKGLTAEALNVVSERRRSTLIPVNAAYTSQTCHCCGFLGKRSADKFYCPTTGCVYQADENAAINIKKRLTDPDISLYTPYREVRRILLERQIANGGDCSTRTLDPATGQSESESFQSTDNVDVHKCL